MAISSVTNRVAYQANGSSAVFNFPYQFDASVELSVFLYNSSASAPALIIPQVLNTHYVISSTAQQTSGIYKFGADVVFNSSPGIEPVVVMFRSSVITNTFSIPQNGPVPSSGLNNALDHMTLIMQRLQDQTTRSVRLPDGMFTNFDPTLPANLRQSVGRRLVVGSTGWTFDELAVGNYIPNTVIVALTNSNVVSLGGAAAGLYLTSNGSSAPTWGPLVLGSGAVPVSSISGILPVDNGGTGTGTSYIRYGVAFASSATQMANTAAGGADVPLLGNGLAAPSFRALTLSSGSSVAGTLPVGNGGTGQAAFTATALLFASSATQIASISSAADGRLLTSHGSSAPSFDAPAITSFNSGVLAVSFGGTGTGTAYIQYGVFFGSSATQMANTSAGGKDQPLVGNSGAAPSYQPINMASGSSVTGGLGVSNGGTGVTALAPQFGVVYMSSTTQMAVVPSAASGQFLQANGSSAPSFASVTVSPIATAVKTAAYNATAADDVLLVSSSNFTVNLYGATGNSGRKLTILKTDTNLAFGITVAGSNATINQSLSTTLNTQGESLDLVCDGTNWVAKRTINQSTNSSLAPTLQGFGTVSANSMYTQRIGDCLVVQGSFVTGSIVAQSAFIQFGVAAVGDVTVDTTKSGANLLTGEFIVGNASVASGTGTIISPVANDTKVFMGIASASDNPGNPARANSFVLNGQSIQYKFKVPILGWKG